jgi:hypothetical protein
MQNLRELFYKKSYSEHIHNVHSLLVNHIPFAYTRISDGEVTMLKGGSIELMPTGALVEGRRVNFQKFKSWDEKSFDPNRDRSILMGLMHVISYSSDNFLIGLPCPCCTTREIACDYQRRVPGIQTWANLLINHNYPFFIQAILPALQDRQIFPVVNISANYQSLFGNLAFDKLSVPNNVLQVYDEFENSFLDHCSRLDNSSVVLVGASAAAKILIMRGNMLFPKLTFIDIGTGLNPLLGLGTGRFYLDIYWKHPLSYGQIFNKHCAW